MLVYGYIYETTNLVNGHKYIGQHASSEFDPNYKGSGKLLWQAIHKYGWDNFKARMLCPCFSQEELDDEEIRFDRGLHPKKQISKLSKNNQFKSLAHLAKKRK